MTFVNQYFSCSSRTNSWLKIFDWLSFVVEDSYGFFILFHFFPCFPFIFIDSFIKKWSQLLRKDSFDANWHWWTPSAYEVDSCFRIFCGGFRISCGALATVKERLCSCLRWSAVCCFCRWGFSSFHRECNLFSWLQFCEFSWRLGGFFEIFPP